MSWNFFACIYKDRRNLMIHTNPNSSLIQEGSISKILDFLPISGKLKKDKEPRYRIQIHLHHCCKIQEGSTYNILEFLPISGKLKKDKESRYRIQIYL